MCKVEPQQVLNNSKVEISSGEPAEAFPLKPVVERTTAARRFRLLRTWLVGGILFLMLRLAIVACILALAACGSAGTGQAGHASSLPTRPLSTPTLSPVATPKPMIIPMPKSTPISSPVSSGHDLNMTIIDGVAYVGSVDNAVYALRISNGTLLWRYQTNGSVNESPLVVDGIVYVSAYAGQMGPDTVYALRADDGALLWHYSNNDDSYIDTPLVENGVTYVGTQKGITAFEADSGTQLWHYPTNGYTSLASSVVNGVIYASSNIDQGPGTVYALQASDGTLLWHYTINSSLYLQTVIDGVVFVDADNGTLAALRANDGHLLWQRTLVGTVYQFAFSNGVIYATALKISETAVGADARSPLQALTIGALLSGASLNVPAQQTMPLKEGQSSVYALRASDGTILWHFSMVNGGDSWASSCSVEDGVVYASTSVPASSTNQGYVYALQGASGSMLWQDKLSTAPSSALLANGIIYLSSNNGSDAGTVYALRARDGSLLWSYPISGSVFQTPILMSGVVYVSAANGMVYALRAENGAVVWHYLTNGGK